MSIAYKRSVSPTTMQDGRRRAWLLKPGLFKVIARSGQKSYEVEVVDGTPRCTCTAATGDNGRFAPRACWHAALVLDRITREPALAGVA